MKKKISTKILTLAASVLLALSFIAAPQTDAGIIDGTVAAQANPVPKGFSYSRDVPEWNRKKPYVVVHRNRPYFTSRELSARKSYEKYGRLDKYGRCTKTIANIGTDIMPVKQRGNIGMVRPTGWHTVKYAGIDGNYLYNRCHLIGYQLSGENANTKNLITGTRYLNVDGMLPYENRIADYMHSHRSSHVLYRVTPVFRGKDLLARGVLMEAESLEDKGKGVKFCVFCYNVQPGVTIRYSDGSSKGPAYRGSGASTRKKTTDSRSSQKNTGTHTYVLNTNTKKFHKPSCSSVRQMAAHNRKTVKAKRSSLISQGYSPCMRCNP